MGYFIEYQLSLRIKAHNVQRALEIFNYLHTPEMLTKHARGSLWPSNGLSVVECKWYSWVDNPVTPYTSLKQAFSNWAIVEANIFCDYDETGDFLVTGSYADKYGQQDFLLSQLACVLENTTIQVYGEDGETMYWIVDDYQWRTDPV